MAFINETVSEADIDKYKLRDINQQYHFALRDMECKWTIDRERDIYVRQMGSGREDLCDHHTFTFYWKTHLFFWTIKFLTHERIHDHSHIVWGLASNKELHLPKDLEEKRDEIMKDFKDAVYVAEEFDFVVEPKSYSVEFKF